MLYVDAHAHLYLMSEDDLKRTFESNIIVFAVSEDVDSSLKTLQLAERYKPMVIPFIGIHPWRVNEFDEKEIDKIAELIRELKKYGGGLGEIGIDAKKPAIEKQMKFFERFLELAAGYRLPVNIHATRLWRIALKMVIEHDVRANFHWYSGPLDLLRDIRDAECFISINPCYIFQAQHHIVVEKAPIEIMLTETDAPFTFRGIKLRSWFVIPLVRKIAQLREMQEEELRKQILQNAKKFLGFFPKI